MHEDCIHVFFSLADPLQFVESIVRVCVTLCLSLQLRVLVTIPKPHITGHLRHGPQLVQCIPVETNYYQLLTIIQGGEGHVGIYKTKVLFQMDLNMMNGTHTRV